MKNTVYVACVLSLLMFTACHEGEDNASAITPGTDATDQSVDGVDAVSAVDGSADSSDALDSADAVEGAPATDGSDVADADDGSDGADGTDGQTGGELGPNGVPYVQLDPPANGFQVRSLGRFIEPGTDVEFCEVITLPGTPEDVYYVDRIEVAMHPWSHHVIIDAVVPGSETDQSVEDGMVKPCVSAASAYGEDLVDVIGAQSPYSDLQLPEGVGRVYYGGQKVIVDYHYFNPTLETIPAGHAINFHRVEQEQVAHVAETFGFYNFQIFTLPGQTSQYAASCVFEQDVMISVLTRHTHRWGTDFHIWYDGGENDGDHIWTSNDWELETNYVYEEPILVKKGEGFRFQCEYDNTTDDVLTFGPKATDEMCILFGIAWSPNALYLEDTGGDLPGANLTCNAAAVPVEDMSTP